MNVRDGVFRALKDDGRQDIIEFSICFEEKYSFAFMANGPYGEYGHWDAMTNKRIAAAR